MVPPFPEEVEIPEPDERAPSPAELFERFFVPAVFTPWTRVLLEHADPGPEDRVLDVACATGVVARQVAARATGEKGRTVGLDISPEMLAVARERAAAEGVDVEWVEGDAMDLDARDDSFDLVLCQQGLQFFPDPAAALREARRVLVDGGRIALNVWQPLDRHPVYKALLEAEARHLNADLSEVAAPFMFGEADRLRSLLREAGFERIDVVEETLQVEFPEAETFVELTVLAGAAVVPELAPDDAEERAALIEAVERASEEKMQEYRVGSGLRFPMPNFIGVAYA